MLDKLRAELNECIDLYGNLHPSTIAKSQELDVEIVKAMKEGLN
jgi:hypothetical protein